MIWLGTKRKMKLCPFQSGAFTPYYCDGDKCELWIPAKRVEGGLMCRGGCALYWSGLIARFNVVKNVGVSASDDVQVMS